MQPTLSLIVPAYNMERFLPACLDSVLVGNPLSDQVEILVVNDGSSDRTGEIAHRYKEIYPASVRVVDKRNGNYGSCINAALPLVSGSYIKILDADDTFNSAAFVRYLSNLSAIPETTKPDVFINDFVEVDVNGKETRRREFGTSGDTAFSLSSLDPLNGRTLWMHAIAYRTDIVQKSDYRQLEGISYTDQQWVVIPLMSAKSFQRCPELVYRYLVGRPGQTMDPSVRLRNFAQHIPVQKAIIEAYAQKHNSLPQETESFVRDHIRAHLSMIYANYLVKNPSLLPESEIVDFDTFLENADIPLFTSIENDFVTFTRWNIRFRYVHEWRMRKTRRTIKFRLFDMAMRLREKRHHSLKTT